MKRENNKKMQEKKSLKCCIVQCHYVSDEIQHSCNLFRGNSTEATLSPKTVDIWVFYTHTIRHAGFLCHGLCPWYCVLAFCSKWHRI